MTLILELGSCVIMYLEMEMICFWKDDDDDWEVERVESYWTQSWRLTPLMDQDQDSVVFVIL